MADLTTVDFKTMDYSYQGEPCVFINTSEINTYTMDYSYRGEPFVINQSSSSKIKKVHTTPWGNIKNIFGKVISGIKTFGSTSTN